VLRAAKAKAGDVKAIGLSGQMHGSVFLLLLPKDEIRRRLTGEGDKLRRLRLAELDEFADVDS
jgi:hypothetical protein